MRVNHRWFWGLVLFALQSNTHAQERQRTEVDENASARSMVEALASSRRLTVDGVAPIEQSLSVPLTFEFGSARLTPAAQRLVATMAQAIGDPSLEGSTFFVEGHTDAVGTDQLNLGLSQARADAVVSQLEAFGVSPARLTAVGYGEGRLLSGFASTDARQRRVELVRRQ